MRVRFWLPCVGLLILGAAACSLAIGQADLTAVHCDDEGHVGAPSCAGDQICLQRVCTDCEVAGICGVGGQGGQGGTGGTGGEAGMAGTGGEAGAGGAEAGPDVNQGGSAGAGGAADDGGTGGTTHDVGPDLVEEPLPDVPEEPALKKLGESCAVSSDCEPRTFCVPTGALYEGTCSKGCCSSSDAQCAADFVCRPGLGGNICVKASVLGLNLGAQLAATDCTSPSDCRSGRCEGGKCMDVCCSDADCAGGNASCAFTPLGSTPTWQCMAWSSGHANSYADSCSSDADCKSNMCVTLITSDKYCSGPCCSGADCSSGFSKCGYFYENGAAVRECYSPYPPACCTNQQCPGQTCSPTWADVSLGQKAWVLRCQ